MQPTKYINAFSTTQRMKAYLFAQAASPTAHTVK